MEETGYDVAVDRLLAVYEEIVTGRKREISHPDYTHKLFFLFLCHVVRNERGKAFDMDMDQKESLWIRLDEIKLLNFYPGMIKDTLLDVLKKDYPTFLGSEKTDSSLAWIPREN